eukprot:3504551-Prymnesium_polylepis.1
MDGLVRDGLLVGAVGVVAAWLLGAYYSRRFSPLTRWRLSSLIRQSQRLYKRQQYDEALSVARAAQQMAEADFGKASSQHQRAMFHLGA